MNLPNKLTMARIIMIPIFLVLLLCPLGLDKQVARYIATGIFCLASITDCLDGYIARKYNLVTNFGKFMDPLADKLLVSSAMIALIGMDDAVVPLRFQNTCSGTEHCNCCRFLGKVKDYMSNVYDYIFAFKLQ